MTLREKLESRDLMCREFAAEADKYQQLYEELLLEVEIFVTMTEGIVTGFGHMMNPNAYKVYLLLCTEDFFVKFKYHLISNKYNSDCYLERKEVIRI